MTTPRKPLRYLDLATEVTPQRPSQENEMQPPDVVDLSVGGTGSNMAATGGPGYVVYQNGVGVPFTSGPPPTGAAGVAAQGDDLPPGGFGPYGIIDFRSSTILGIPVAAVTVTPDPGNNRNIVQYSLLLGGLITVLGPALSGYTTIQVNGSPLAQEHIVNLIACAQDVRGVDNPGTAATDITLIPQSAYERSWLGV